MGRYKRSRQDAFHPAGRPAQVAGASIPAAAFVRAYEGELRRSSPPAPRLIRWAGADDVWADR